MGSDADQFLDKAGAGYPAVKFKEVGDTVRGKILDEPKVLQRPNMNDGKLEDNLVINMDTTGEESGYRTLWVKFGFLATAIKEAVRDSGATGLAPGGELAVQFNELRDSAPVSAGTRIEDIF
jgi:hypothetical protein